MRTTISKKISPAFAQMIKNALKACTSCEVQNACDVSAIRCGSPDYAILDVEPREGHTIEGNIMGKIVERLTDEGVKVNAWEHTPRYGVVFIERLTAEGNR